MLAFDPAAFSIQAFSPAAFSFDESAVPLPPTFYEIGRRDLRKKRRAEMARQTRRRHEAEFFLVAMP